MKSTKKLYLFFLFFFFLSPSSALNFGISPDTINSRFRTGETKCENFNLIGDSTLIFSGEVLFSEFKSTNINDYKLNETELDLEIDFPLQTVIGTHQICFYSKIPGKYYGTLKYKIQDSNYGLAIWIELESYGEEITSIQKEELSEKPTTLLTGGIIRQISQENQTKTLAIILFTLLLIFLIIILFKKQESPSNS